MTLTTKGYGDENSWSLGACSSNRSYANNQEYTQQCCLAPGNYNLQCKDSYGDGWQGGYIEVDGIRHCDDFNSGKVQTIAIMIKGRVKLHWTFIYMIFILKEYVKCFLVYMRVIIFFSMRIGRGLWI